MLSDSRQPLAVPMFRALPQDAVILLIGPDVPVEAVVASYGLEAVMEVVVLEGEVLASADALEVPEATFFRGLPLEYRGYTSGNRYQAKKG